MPTGSGFGVIVTLGVGLSSLLGVWVSVIGPCVSRSVGSIVGSVVGPFVSFGSLVVKMSVSLGFSLVLMSSFLAQAVL